MHRSIFAGFLFGNMLSQVRVTDSLQLARTRPLNRYTPLVVGAHGAGIVRFSGSNTVHGAGAVIVVVKDTV
jgi:hypothetical protein